MELIIDIPEEVYKSIQDNDYCGILNSDMYNAVKKGTPLDLKGLKSDMKALNCGYPYGLDYLLNCLDKRLGISLTKINRESEVQDADSNLYTR